MNLRLAWLRSLRARTVAAFVAAVVAANLIFALAAGVVLYLHERSEAAAQKDPSAPESGEDDDLALVQKVAAAMAVAAPFTLLGAALLGVWLAGRTLSPMREAAARARTARAGSGELELPLGGSGDEWDELATVTNELLRDQRRAVERARSFGANAAHELRTPLAAMLGELQVALRRERTPEEYRAVLAGVEEEAGRLTSLVNSLLQLARAESNEPRPPAAPFELGEAAAAAASRARASAGVREARIELAGAARALGDPVTTGRILDNLLDNALRHGKGPVELAVFANAKNVILHVTDEGPGIAEPVRSRLFERFNHSPDAAEGFGLGLSIARALAEAQGGRLYLDEASARTRLVLELPRAL